MSSIKTRSMEILPMMIRSMERLKIMALDMMTTLMTMEMVTTFLAIIMKAMEMVTTFMAF
jgi:hypothetical protein